jgi:hypothetical protein
MYERPSQPLLTTKAYLRRQLVHILIALTMIFGSLFLGIIGYHWLEALSWIDSLVNAAMILGGMGPVNELHTNYGKLFASFYALYSGIVFLIAAGVMVVPFFHRFLHRFHLEQGLESPDSLEKSPQKKDVRKPRHG